MIINCGWSRSDKSACIAAKFVSFIAHRRFPNQIEIFRFGLNFR